MLQLRSFIQQRLQAAAQEIIGEVEKTITLVLSGDDDHRPPEEELQSQRPKLDPLPRISAAEPQVTDDSSAAEEEVLQKTARQESNPSSVEVPTADTQNSDGSYCFVLFDFDSQTQEVIPPEAAQDQPETRATYELEPLSSDCSAAGSESDSDEEFVPSKGAQTKTKRRKVLQRQKGSMKKKSQAAVTDGDSSAKSEKDRCVCPVCGKGFQYMRPFTKHLKTHEKTSEPTKELLTHLQRDHNNRAVCDLCGKKFKNLGCLQTHSKIHTGIKDFKCRECGKTFIQKEHLIVHTRTHSGERPYSCGSCGKLFYTQGHLKAHMKRFSGEKPHSCDICGKVFCQRGQLVRHKDAHIAGSIE